MERTSRTRSRNRWRTLALAGAFSVLLAQFVVWAGPSSAQVPSPVLYGANGGDESPDSSLYTINPATGGMGTTIGDIGFAVTGLAVDPTTGQLFGVTAGGDNTVGPGALLKINKATGAGTFVGYVFLDCDDPVNDITFTTTGQLFGYARNNCAQGERLVQINKATGRGTVLGPSGAPDGGGGGLAADPDDNTLWLTPQEGDGTYGTVDPTTGVFTSQGTLDGTGDFGDNINALAWSCDGETLFASIRDGFFATINTATDDLVEVGRSAPAQDAIAWDCAPPQPVVQCKGQPATITGTTGNDNLTGTNGKDVVAARGGKDKISALGGNDVVCAGGGKDTANGGGGKDQLRGQGGNDKLKGAGGKDNLRGGGGRDTCNGGGGTDKGNCEVEKSIP
jgi:Ca2+-binding RTX toxin-like protein